MPIDVAPSPSPQTSDLFNLPAELRNRICWFVVIEEDAVASFFYDKVHTWVSNNGGFFTSQPTITKVSRQLRSESLPLYYGLNGFYLNPNEGGGKHAFDARARAIRKDTLAHLQRITPSLLVNGKESRQTIVQGPLRHRWCLTSVTASLSNYGTAISLACTCFRFTIATNSMIKDVVQASTCVEMRILAHS